MESHCSAARNKMKSKATLPSVTSPSNFVRLLVIMSLTIAAFNLLRARELTSESAPLEIERGSKRFHTMITSDGSSYQLWQSRIMYYWYINNRGPEMGGFTRILHSGRPDGYMHEIPTFVSQPVPNEDFLPLHRPYGVLQWLKQADIKEDYIFMSEPDHLIVRPIPNMATTNYGVAFPFLYMEPHLHQRVIKKHFPDGKLPRTRIEPIGNCPAILSKEALKKITPHWLSMSLSMRRDPETYQELGWILEMYAYAMASALNGYSYKLIDNFEVQAPFDKRLGEAYIVHYTYGLFYDSNGKNVEENGSVWGFDKRRYMYGPPMNLTLPPAGTPDIVVKMITMLQDATSNIKL